MSSAVHRDSLAICEVEMGRASVATRRKKCEIDEQSELFDYLDVEGVENGRLDGGDVGVEDRQLQVLEGCDGPDELPRPPTREDLDHGVEAQQPDLNLGQAGPVLRNLLSETAAVVEMKPINLVALLERQWRAIHHRFWSFATSEESSSLLGLQALQELL
ncbi:hypothetical protein BHE74_00035621 [Ensete ventricosum]|uniref:Uncharacterized protein n=1 Tax=Ensete ventricosum TaxID=4639 RepID=A0A427AKD3_ENSVE|nr:hypothetical protein B296_00029761 [Ensete ventricosum]RWW57574.1 hypothetical protein BHE74_00035621 [Ensete ventricosum]RZS08500.1 hypothetical protein BHM03_00039476 [Ensete ventricosum]